MKKNDKMINIINKYLGLKGLLTALPMICIVAYYKYYFNNEFEILASLGILFCITSMTLHYELKKGKTEKMVH